MTNTKLIDAQTFTDENRWYMRLVYEYIGDDQKTHLRIFPKVEFPLEQDSVPTIIEDDRLDLFNPYIWYLAPRAYTRLCPSQDDEALKRGIDVEGVFFDAILETEPKKMTLEEIEKELGYSVVIVKEKNNA